MSTELIPLLPLDASMKRAYEKNRTSPLFANLPLELRLAIYGFATCYDTLIYPQQCPTEPNKFHHRFDSWDPSHEKEYLDYSTLKTVCRQLYHELECSGVFYAANDFTFYYLKDLHIFLTTIPPEKSRHIRTIRIEDPLSEDEIHDDWWLRTPTLEAVVVLLRNCTQLRLLMLDMVGLVAGASTDDEEWITTPFRTFHAHTLLEFIRKTAQGSQGASSVVCSELFWKLPQFRLAMHVHYFSPTHSPDRRQGSKFDLCGLERLVVDLTDTSDLQWLRSARGQRDDYFGQRGGPLEEQAFRDLVLETKIAVAEYRSRLS